ncbi:cell cycle checkpoint control protein RAD9A isoform X3 [Sorex araneus]|uniref:cell cycle checkpoint control protein RAD9A isoform X3 n=1 Tax=Sorex araneus TaxID=42254 RepID=UPI0024335C29|nr:cell cycle checkpoint control protein RAD9A isoform X3 [Sorex araneus]
MKCLVTGGNVKALPAHRELLPLGLCLLPLRPALLPAVPGPRARPAPPALQDPDEVVPVRLPLAGCAGEDSGAMLPVPQRPEQPPGGPAALQIRVLAEAILPFPLALAEVTLGIGADRRVILRSYQEEEADSPARAMVTQMSLGEADFQTLQAREGVAVTFCLKEFRGLLSFAESANLSLSIHFDGPGRPAVFAVTDSLLDGHFVLATLSEPDPPAPAPGPSAPRRSQSQSQGTPNLDDFAGDDIDSYMIAMETPVGSSEGSLAPDLPRPHNPSPPKEEEEEEEESEDAEPGTVPGTPPTKKFRSLFFGSILGPARSPQGPSPVLAEDSEGEG